jgi:hypothetical protein
MMIIVFLLLAFQLKNKAVRGANLGERTVFDYPTSSAFSSITHRPSSIGKLMGFAASAKTVVRRGSHVCCIPVISVAAVD